MVLQMSTLHLNFQDIFTPFPSKLQKSSELGGKIVRSTLHLLKPCHSAYFALDVLY